MSSQDKPKKDIKGKGREVPLGKHVSGQSEKVRTEEQGSQNGLLRSFQGVSNSPPRPSREVSSETIQWLGSIPILPIPPNEPSQNHELHRTISEPGAGNARVLRPDLIDAVDVIFRTLIKPRINASSNTPQPCEESDHRSRSNSAADANGRQMKMGLRPHSNSDPTLQRPIFTNPNINRSINSAENRGPISTDYVLRLLCPGLPNEFQTHAFFGYDADGATEICEPGFPVFSRGVGQASATYEGGQSLIDSSNNPSTSNKEAASCTATSSEAASRTLGQDRIRAQPNQRSPLSTVDTIEHAPLVDPPLMSHARSSSGQYQSPPQMALSYHPRTAQGHQDVPLPELSTASDMAGDMPSIGQVLQQSTAGSPIHGSVGMGESYRPMQELLLSYNEEFITSAMSPQGNIIPPRLEISHYEGRQHSSHASTLVGNERNQSRWRRIWHGLTHRRRSCLCSLPAREASEANFGAHNPNTHTTESDYHPSAPTYHAYILGWRDVQESSAPPPRGSQNEEAIVLEETSSSGDEAIPVHQETDAISNAPTLIPSKGLFRRLQDRMKAILERLMARRAAAETERGIMEDVRQAEHLTVQEAEAAARAEFAQFPGISEVEASNMGDLMDKGR